MSFDFDNLPQPNEETSRYISRQFNLTYVFSTIYATVICLIGGAIAWDVGYVTFGLFLDVGCFMSWVFVRWYVFRTRDPAEVQERYFRMAYRRKWDAPSIRRPRSDRTVSKSHARFVLSTFVLMAVALHFLLLGLFFASRTQ